MKRALELQKLSHDHHRGLVLARRVKESLAKAETSVDAVRSAILAEFDAVLIKHFDLEERFLVPPMQRSGHVALVDRLLQDHRAVCALVGLGGSMRRDDAHAFAVLLEEHIRFEEQEFFEEAQRVLNDDERKALADAMAHR